MSFNFDNIKENNDHLNKHTLIYIDIDQIYSKLKKYFGEDLINDNWIKVNNYIIDINYNCIIKHPSSSFDIILETAIFLIHKYLIKYVCCKYQFNSYIETNNIELMSCFDFNSIERIVSLNDNGLALKDLLFFKIIPNNCFLKLTCYKFNDNVVLQMPDKDIAFIKNLYKYGVSISIPFYHRISNHPLYMCKCKTLECKSPYF